jgi:hypothetical protein
VVACGNLTIPNESAKEKELLNFVSNLWVELNFEFIVINEDHMFIFFISAKDAKVQR